MLYLIFLIMQLAIWAEKQRLSMYANIYGNIIKTFLQIREIYFTFGNTIFAEPLPS